MTWKFKIVLLLLLALIVSAMTWHVLTLQSNIVKMAGIHNAKLYSDTIASFRTLYTSEILKVAGEHDLEITHLYPAKDKSIPLPATFSILLGKQTAEAGSGATVKLYSPYPFPWRQDSGGLQDVFSQEAWNAVTEKPTIPFYRFEKQNNRHILRYAVADWMRDGCTDCHNQHPNTPKTGWETGDVAGVLEINLPLDSIIATSRSDIKGTIAIYGVLALITAIGIFMLIMKDRRQSMKLEKMVKDRTIEFEYQKVRAENATRSKSEFLASMSHEIRTPMSVILGMAEVLKETELSPEQGKHLNILNRAGNTLLRLIDDILDLSKVEAGHIELENIEFELENELAEIGSIMSVIARQNNLKLSHHLEPDVPAKFIGDPKRLRQILFNLVSNAIKFTEKGRIDINVRRLGVSDNVAELEFYVRDTGIGIPEDKQGIIFDGFTQVGLSTTRDFGGTGLGTTISKKFIELMGGRIWVESKLGEGSTFYYTVKLKVAATEGDENTVEKVIDGKPISWERPLRILIAEGSEDNLILMQMYLDKTPHIFDMAKNGKIAIEKFQSAEYDLVLMDMEMPVMDGYTATKEIRKWEAKEMKKQTPIVALTAHTLKEHEQKSLDAGCTAHIVKPFKKKEFLEAIYEYTSK